MASDTPLKRFALLSLVLLAFWPASAGAQIPTGTVTGQVFDTQGRPIAGATVTATSPALQGEQTTTSSANGAYILKFLPPGPYTISFEAPGFGAAGSSRTVAAAEPVTIDITLQPAAVRETVNVVGDNAQFINTIEGASNLKQGLLSTLPTARTMLSAVNLAPGVHDTGPNGNFSIAGAMSFENLFMLNGVQIQDNLRGDPYSLFIEDAIQETTITTSGISAEYGRFSGGIVNTLTKSGSNKFAGSWREAFNNDNWRSVSPFGEPKVDSTVPTSEFTFGGPILKDRTWFFAAGRFEDAKLAEQTAYTKLPFTFEQNEKRFEGKVTQALAPGQRLEVDYTGISNTQTNSAWPDFSSVMDLASLTNPDLPENLVAVHYTGTFGSKLFVEAQYSARTFTFKHSGGLQTDLIHGTPLLDQQTGAWWWAPNFCGVCADEERNNDSLVLKGSYFLSTGHGAHNLVFGYDGFNDKTRADNHQSASDYHVWATGSFIDNGTVYPVIDPGFSTYIINWPIQESSQGTNFRTHGLFINDSWAYDTHWSFNLGLRYDKNAGRDASGTLVAKDSVLSPRLGVAWDPRGDGRTSVRASAGRYVAAVNNSVAGSTAAAGTPSIIAYFYDGPSINDGSGPLVGTADALQQVFDWYDAARPDPFEVDLPGVATRIDGSLKSPHADEFTVGVSHEIGNRTSVRVDVVTRKFGDFYSKRADGTTGSVADALGQPFDLKLIENTNQLERRYRALNVSGTYRPDDNLAVGANYTLSRLWGNTDGETIANGPIPSDILLYPEYQQTSWSFPVGDLSLDQRHRARIWATYTLPWARRVGTMSVGFIEQAESGTPYGAASSVVVSPFVTDAPAYLTPPDLNTYYFTARDAYRTAAMYRSDLSFNFSRRIQSTRSPEVFASFQLLNAFNQFQVFNNSGGAINTTVITAVDDDSLQLFDPFTETPVEGVNWKKGSKFGQPISKSAYTVPRTFRFSVGVRF